MSKEILLKAKNEIERLREQNRLKEEIGSRIETQVIGAVAPLVKVLDEMVLSIKESVANIKLDMPNMVVTVPVPQINIPEIKLPSIHVPEVKLPVINIPEVKLPIINVPESKITVNVPEIKLPRSGHMGLIDKPFDEVEMRYLGEQVSDIVYKNEGEEIGVVHLDYDSKGNLERAKRL